MGTILFDSVIFGPVKSRRLGNSLGINLLPNDSKLCNYNCIYCECGWTFHSHQSRKKFHPVMRVLTSLEEKLKELREKNDFPDTITFAGNGEPTLHPEFAEIVAGVISLRDEYCSSTKIAVLSNGTMVHKDNIYEALRRVDSNMLKLDTAIEETYRLLNRPPADFNMAKLINNLSRFSGHYIIQSLFLRGQVGGKFVDNTSQEELIAWLSLVEKLKPVEVHIYSLARETASSEVMPVENETLEKIGESVKQRKILASVFN